MPSYNRRTKLILLFTPPPPLYDRLCKLGDAERDWKWIIQSARDQLGRTRKGTHRKIKTEDFFRNISSSKSSFSKLVFKKLNVAKSEFQQSMQHALPN